MYRSVMIILDMKALWADMGSQDKLTMENTLLNSVTCAIFALGGTLFSPKDRHKLTCRSNDGFTHKQLDHTAVSRCWRRSLLNSRLYINADVRNDHHLVIESIKIKLKKATSCKAEGMCMILEI